jgi:hypothetical protein
VTFLSLLVEEAVAFVLALTRLVAAVEVQAALFGDSLLSPLALLP